jgi:hypothetical protein
VAAYIDGLEFYNTEHIKQPARKHGNKWCHLFADTDDELHAFAARLGLKRSYAQSMNHVYQRFHHYDLTPNKRMQAVRLGAVEIDAGERGRETARIIEEIHQRDVEQVGQKRLV